jgi:signal transduction histidine kinase
VMLQHLCERSATAVGARLRDLFGGPLLQTIEGIGHRELKAYDLERVDRFFRAGTTAYPYVTRFFLWHERLPSRFHNQVLFYRPPGEPGPRHMALADDAAAGGLFADRGVGEAVWRTSQRAMRLRKGFAVEHFNFEGLQYQAVFHFFWTSPTRDRVYGVLGFLVDLDAIRTGFRAIAATGLEPLLNPHPLGVQLALHVEDENGGAIYGSPASIGEIASSEEFDLLFFPRERLQHYLASLPEVPRWRMRVSPATTAPVAAQPGVWLLGAIVILLLGVAVVCAVKVNRQAVRLSELQSDFVANASHQLRTPLAMLSAAAETLGLERVRSPEKVKEYAEIVKAQTHRLSVLVDQILHFHRAELARVAVVRQPVNLTELVERVVAQFQVLGEGAAVTMRIDGDRQRLMVLGDPMTLEYAVTNLLENAVKYGGGRPNEVTVVLEARHAHATIVVRDCGAGIERVDLPHIFDKFYRGRAEGASRRGFGLGLAIVQSTVTVHGGEIAVKSEPGLGSEFRVMLPLLA